MRNSTEEFFNRPPKEESAEPLTDEERGRELRSETESREKPVPYQQDSCTRRAEELWRSLQRPSSCAKIWGVNILFRLLTDGALQPAPINEVVTVAAQETDAVEGKMDIITHSFDRLVRQLHDRAIFELPGEDGQAVQEGIAEALNGFDPREFYGEIAKMTGKEVSEVMEMHKLYQVGLYSDADLEHAPGETHEDKVSFVKNRAGFAYPELGAAFLNVSDVLNAVQINSEQIDLSGRTKKDIAKSATEQVLYHELMHLFLQPARVTAPAEALYEGVTDALSERMLVHLKKTTEEEILQTERTLSGYPEGGIQTGAALMGILGEERLMEMYVTGNWNGMRLAFDQEVGQSGAFDRVVIEPTEIDEEQLMTGENTPEAVQEFTKTYLNIAPLYGVLSAVKDQGELWGRAVEGMSKVTGDQIVFLEGGVMTWKKKIAQDKTEMLHVYRYPQQPGSLAMLASTPESMHFQRVALEDGRLSQGSYSIEGEDKESYLEHFANNEIRLDRNGIPRG